MRPALTAALIALVLPLAACEPPPRRTAIVHGALVSPYRLDSGDRLRVVVFGQGDLSNSYTVDQAGYIAMPLIGAVPTRGRTTAMLEGEIAGKLKDGYVRNPDVTVEVDRYRPFFVMGEVSNAGQYPYVNGMTVQTAVAIAGGFTPRAAKRRFDVTRHVNGEVITLRLGPADPVLPGDTINVRERFL